MTQPTVVTVKDILLDAAGLIETHGWIRHEYGTPAKGFCAMGALYSACDVRFHDSFKVTLARNALRKAAGLTNTHSIVNWNDYKAESKEQVIETFRKAAEICEEANPHDRAEIN